MSPSICWRIHSYVLNRLSAEPERPRMGGKVALPIAHARQVGGALGDIAADDVGLRSTGSSGQNAGDDPVALLVHEGRRGGGRLLVAHDHHLLDERMAVPRHAQVDAGQEVDHIAVEQDQAALVYHPAHGRIVARHCGRERELGIRRIRRHALPGLELLLLDVDAGVGETLHAADMIEVCVREDDDIDILGRQADLLERPGDAVTAGDEAVPQLLLDRIVRVDAGIHQDVGAILRLDQRHRMDVLLDLVRLGVAHHAVEELGAPRADAVLDVGDLVVHGFLLAAIPDRPGPDRGKAALRSRRPCRLRQNEKK